MAAILSYGRDTRCVPYPQEKGTLWRRHLSGRVAAALMAQAPDLFDGSPKIEKVDVLAPKLGVN